MTIFGGDGLRFLAFCRWEGGDGPFRNETTRMLWEAEGLRGKESLTAADRHQLRPGTPWPPPAEATAPQP